jgi:hypothetical protein
VRKFKYELGTRAKNIITGVKGIITARVQYLTGCDQYCIQSKSKDGNSAGEATWVDVNAMKPLKGKKLEIKTNKSVGGVSSYTPKTKN